MKNPVKILFEEHAIIQSAIDIAKNAATLIENNNSESNHDYETLIRELIHFFRAYADEYHHYKEEQILFPEMSKKNELLEDGVLKEMFENHADFRSMIESIEMFLDCKDYKEAQQKLNSYTEALLDHIAVENDEVFQMAESLFKDEELEKIYFRFADCDRELGEINKTNLVNQLNKNKI